MALKPSLSAAFAFDGCVGMDFYKRGYDGSPGLNIYNLYSLNDGIIVCRSKAADAFLLVADCPLCAVNLSFFC